jgi:hypothetical protein
VNTIEIIGLALFCLIGAAIIAWLVVFYPLRHDRQFKRELQVGQVLLWHYYYLRGDANSSKLKAHRSPIRESTIKEISPNRKLIRLNDLPESCNDEKWLALDNIKIMDVKQGEKNES